MDIALTALIVVLLLLVEHYLPWRMLAGRELPRVANYSMGVLAIVLPLSCLYAHWSYDQPADPYLIARVLLAMWVVVISGGVIVFFAYWVDDWLIERSKSRECEERETHLLGEIEK